MMDGPSTSGRHGGHDAAERAAAILAAWVVRVLIADIRVVRLVALGRENTGRRADPHSARSGGASAAKATRWSECPSPQHDTEARTMGATAVANIIAAISRIWTLLRYMLLL